jgi:hypothetical protein
MADPPRVDVVGGGRGRSAAIRGSCLVASILTLTMLPGVARAVPSVLVPERGAYLGSWVAPRVDEDGHEPIRRVERAIDRRFAIDHRYYRWDQELPTAYDRATFRAGRLAFVSWKAMRIDGSIVPWQEIANGDRDRWITLQARRFEAFGAPIYVSFHDEPEDDAAFGSPAEFAAAYRRIVEIFRAERVHNVAFVWTMMSWTFDPGSGRDPMDWYPGDGYVDVVGTNGYNWFPMRSGARWLSFRQIVAPTIAFAAERDKPVFVVECGVMEDPSDPERKATWFRRIPRAVERWARLKGVIYFDEVKDGYPWVTDSSPNAIAGYADLAASPWLSTMPGSG